MSIKSSSTIKKSAGPSLKGLGTPKADWKAAMTGGAETSAPSAVLELPESAPALGVIPSPAIPAPVVAKPEVVKPEVKKPEAEAKKPIITKRPMDTLENGLTYSLLSRVRNAFSEADRKTTEAGKPVLNLVDGRGTDQQISSAYVAIALGLKDEKLKLSGAALLRTIRTSHVKTMLKSKVAEKKKEAKV